MKKGIVKRNGIEYQAFAEKTQRVERQIRMFRTERRCLDLPSRESRILKLNDMAVVVMIRPDTRLLTREDRSSTVKQILSDLSDLGYEIEQPRFFGHKIKMEWYDPEGAKRKKYTTGYYLYVPFAVGRIAK